VPNTPMLGRGKQSCLTPRSYKIDKLLTTLRLSGVTLSKLLRISVSINSLIVIFCNAMCFKHVDCN
jgi:hypothetical protein